MGKTFNIKPIESGPKFLLGLIGKVNRIIKAITVLSEMEGDGNIIVKVTDSNVKFALRSAPGGVGEGGILFGETFLYVREAVGGVTIDFGTVGNVTPPGVGDGSVLSPGAFVWVKVVIGSAGFHSYKVTSALIQTGASVPDSDAPNATTGAPGTDFYVKLADINSGVPSNTGNGSFGFAPALVGRACVPGVGEEEDEVIDVKNIFFYRMQP